ncbi:MAG: outer membrane beta-barrel protein [Phenylobacterium sp.]|uniref:TonB-dependent receptor plug domain-containing protein n=1 Tax=Phenylobacterium sp. TaxID=1871053 RepID=UPI0025E6B661|nr:TonB-dependent receptor [Phenylobacterium sp.]MBI1200077.1 outer membrane beta-barrel protein [Phenylobacterium sp.]
MLIATLLAQAAVAAAPQPATALPDGVIGYPASFFEGQQVANAAEMLARVPGFTLDTGDDVRGYEGAAGNVVIDGQRPASKSDNLEEILRRIPVSQVERIDIIRGGAPGIDMQGKTVIANVIKKKGGGWRGLYQAVENHLWDGRNMTGMRLELSGGDGTRTWEATARYGYGNDDGGEFGPLVRLGPDGQVIRRADVKSESDGLQQILTAAYSQPLLGGRISLNGRAFWDSWKSEETDRFTQPADFGASNDVNPYDEFQTELGARYSRDLGARTKLELVGLRTDTDYHTFDLFTFRGGADEFRNKRNSSETIGRAVLKHQMSSALSFEFGGEAALNDLDSETSVFSDGAPIPLPAADVRVKEKRAEVFGKGTWRLSPAWTFDASLRYEASKITSDGDVALSKSLGFLKPRLAATWTPVKNTQLRFRVERVVGQLDFDDFVAGSDFSGGTGVSAGNPDLNPEQAWVGEAAIEQRFWKSAAVTLTYRHSELSDVIDRGPVRLTVPDPVTGQPTAVVFDQPTNIGDGTKDELTATLNLPFDHFGWNGALLRGEINRRWASVTDPTTLTHRNITRLRPLEWEAHFSQDLPDLGASLGFDVYGGWQRKTYQVQYVTEVKLEDAYLTTWVEKRLDPDTIVRFEIGNWTKRGIRITTAAYDGPRDTGALSYVDDRHLKPGHNVYIRVRHTFGG